MRRPVLAALVAGSLAACAGCSSNAALTATVTDPPDYSCEDITVPGHTLTDGRLASELSAAGRRTVLATEGVTRANLNTWRIVEDSAARVTIIRPLAEPEKVGGQVVASHQYVDRTPYRRGDPARSRWTTSIPLTCTLRELVPGPAERGAPKLPTAKKPARPAAKPAPAARRVPVAKLIPDPKPAPAAAAKAAAPKA